MDAVARLVEGAAAVGARFDGADASCAVRSMSHADLLALVSELAEVRRGHDHLMAIATAEVDGRSARTLGVDGLAQKAGHRTSTSLLQQLTGTARTEVNKLMRVGVDLAATPPVAVDGPAAVTPVPWFAPLTEALRDGRLSADLVDAIRRGLGEVPLERYPDVDPEIMTETWRAAAVRLIDEAADQHAEDLAQSARILRDAIDPRGVALRFEERYERRAFSLRRGPDGQRRGTFVFDDEGAAWLEAILDASLRPRRRPRFVASGVDGGGADAGYGASGDGASGDGVSGDGSGVASADDAARTAVDERTREQQQYDTLMAVMRVGALADPDQAFGDRQPGVRIAITADELERVDGDGALRGNGFFVDRGDTASAGVVEKYLCNVGSRPILFDLAGRPLDVGREQRLFTPKQRDALRLRDGGCVWPGCGAPASWTEVHHIDHWQEHGGLTNVDDGVLLCMSCHLRLHNQGWRITRDEYGYLLHPPPDRGGSLTRIGGGVLIRLRSKSPRRFDGIGARIRRAMAEHEAARVE